MTFAPERVDWRRVIIPNLLLLGVVSHAHPNVVIARTTVNTLGENIADDGKSIERTTRC